MEGRENVEVKETTNAKLWRHTSGINEQGLLHPNGQCIGYILGEEMFL